MGNQYHLALLRTDCYKSNSAVLITGASSGLGKALALQYALQSAKLLLVARDQERLQQVARGCRDMGSQAQWVVCDVSKQEQCKKAVEQAVKLFGGLDILVLNAGVNARGSFQQVKDMKLLDTMMDINFRGYVHFTKYALPYLKRSQGNIVVISSVSGEIGLADRSFYCASKFAVNGFFQALRKQVKFNITIVSLPTIDTPMREHDLLHPSRGAKKGLSAEQCARVIRQMSSRRVKKVIFPLKAYMGVYLKPFSGLVQSIIDSSAKL